MHVAYQALGDGPDLVFVPGWISHVEVAWEVPPLADFLSRLARFARLILIDKRGTGLSDPLPQHRPAMLEERIDDVRAVMDEVDSDCATLLGVSEGGPMNVLFAATHPERTAGLVLYGTFARVINGDGYTAGVAADVARRNLEVVRNTWGQGYIARYIGPSFASDPAMVEALARYERMAASPGAAVALLELNADVDVRDVLPSVQVPTLVLHRDESFVPIASGRHLAERIPGARFVEVSGRDHLFFAEDYEEIVGEIEEFVTGRRGGSEPDRLLTTIVFTDIVDSTRRAAESGDQTWRRLLDAHDAFVRRQLERFRGREVKNTGDGFLACFDGPGRAARCAQAIVDGAQQLGIAIRAGVHTGECEMRGEDLAGLAVNTAARIMALAGAGEVLVSSTVRDLVAGSVLDFEDRGVHELSGVPQAWRLFRVSGV